MKPFFRCILFALLFSPLCNGQNQDFGMAGLKGLSSVQLADLANGEIVFLNADNKNDNKSSLIEAALVFSATPATTWKLISKTEDQPKYIDHCKEVKVKNRSSARASEVHRVGNSLLTFNYGVIQNYFPEKLCLSWMLDTSYPENDLVSLRGYWQFYPYGKGKTLARYGSNVSFKNLPEFVENMFSKGGVKDALKSVKKYVDSGGTYRK